MTKKMTDKEKIQKAVMAQESMRTNRLDLYNNKITDISALSGLANLEVLYLDYNQIADISVLSGLTNLTVLDLDNNKITDISALQKLKQNGCKIYI